MSQNKHLDALIEYIVSAQEYVPLSADAKTGVDMLIDVQATLHQENTPVAVSIAGRFYCLECRSFVSQEELNRQILHPGWAVQCGGCGVLLAPITLLDQHATQPLQGAQE